MEYNVVFASGRPCPLNKCRSKLDYVSDSGLDRFGHATTQLSISPIGDTRNVPASRQQRRACLVRLTASKVRP